MAYSIDERPIHLGLGARAHAEPNFTGAMQWYDDYSTRHAADGAKGRLVSFHRFTEPWAMWEMHPAGDEVVLCMSGSITLHQTAADGQTGTIDLKRGDYAINAPGVRHTADIEGEATALFITAGEGTQHRPR